MKIDLSNIAGTPGGRGRYPISERVPETRDFSCSGPVAGEITVENAGSLLLVRGRLSGRFKLSCARCLAEYERSFEIDVEEEFATGETEPDVSTIDREEPEASAICDYVLDVSELVRQQVAVSVPIAAACRPECRGICPQCGQNLNEGDCDCPAPLADSRWEALASLLEGKSEQKRTE